MLLNWTIAYHKSTRILNTTLSGNYNLVDAAQMRKVIIAEIVELRCNRVLIDARKLEYIEVSFLDIHKLPEVYLQEAVLFFPKIAVIYSPEFLKLFRFYETICISRSLPVLIFPNTQEAVNWLLKSD